MDMDLVEGMRFDKGYISPYFVTDPDRMEAVLDDPYILLVGSKISAVRDIAGAREGHAVGQAAGDHRRGRRGRGPGHPRGQQDPWHLPVGGGQGPGFGERRKAMLQDMAILTGAQVITEEVASSSRTPPSTCSAPPGKVVITKDETTVVEGGGSDDDIAGSHRPDQGRDRQHRLRLRP